MTRKFLALALAALLLAGCPSRGGKTPRDTFDIAQGYVRDGKYDRLWALYSEEYQQEISGELLWHQDIVRNILAQGGSNVGEWAKFVADQYATSMQGFLELTPPQMRARLLKLRRDEILQLKIIGEIDVRGDRATFLVAKDEKDTPATWSLKKVEDRWIIEATSTGHPNLPGGAFPR